VQAPAARRQRDEPSPRSQPDALSDEEFDEDDVRAEECERAVLAASPRLASPHAQLTLTLTLTSPHLSISARAAGGRVP